MSPGPTPDQIAAWRDSTGHNPVNEALTQTGLTLAHVQVSDPSEPLSAEALEDLAALLVQARAALDQET